MNITKANIEKLRYSFLENGYCRLSINQLFHSELTLIYDDFASYDSKYWSYIIKYGDFETDIPVDSSSFEIKKHYMNSLTVHSQGEFSFFFKRMCLDHELDLPITESFTEAKKLVSSSQFIQLLQSITGRQIGEMNQFYINLFDYGDFLGIHSDGGNNIGIAINITKNWLPTFGGITHVVDQCLNIVDSLTPTFGQMFLFDSKENNIPHFVSTVSTERSGKRMSIIARFD